MTSAAQALCCWLGNGGLHAPMDHQNAHSMALAQSQRLLLCDDPHSEYCAKASHLAQAAAMCSLQLHRPATPKLSSHKSIKHRVTRYGCKWVQVKVVLHHKSLTWQTLPGSVQCTLSVQEQQLCAKGPPQTVLMLDAF
jgi:hypothetical protein